MTTTESQTTEEREPADRQLSGAGALGALRRLWQPVLFVLILAIVVWGFFSSHRYPGVFGFDFRGTLWDAGRILQDGRSPYPAPESADLANGNPALYPPFAIAAAIPLAGLPWGIAVALWSMILVAGVVGGTWLLGVRDWRCYCVVLGSLPVLQGLLYGNLTILLLLGVGAAWHLRARPAACGWALGAVVAAKLFLWPLGVWALLQRRFRASIWAVGAALLLMLVPWAAIGFKGLRQYPELLRTATDLYGPHTSSLLTAGLGADLPLEVARLLPLLAAALLLLAAAFVSRRDDGDRLAFALAVVAAIAGSPIVWNYYLVLLVAPIAVMSPRLSWLWATLPAIYVVDLANHRVAEIGPPPPGVPSFAWGALHSSAPVAHALAIAGFLALFTLVLLRFQRRPGSGDTGPRA